MFREYGRELRDVVKECSRPGAIILEDICEGHLSQRSIFVVKDSYLITKKLNETLYLNVNIRTNHILMYTTTPLSAPSLSASVPYTGNAHVTVVRVVDSHTDEILFFSGNLSRKADGDIRFNWHITKWDVDYGDKMKRWGLIHRFPYKEYFEKDTVLSTNQFLKDFYTSVRTASTMHSLTPFQ